MATSVSPVTSPEPQADPTSPRSDGKKIEVSATLQRDISRSLLQPQSVAAKKLEKSGSMKDRLNAYWDERQRKKKITDPEVQADIKAKVWRHNAIREGWLTKQGGSRKTWKRRWFVLHGGRIYYFKEPSDAEPKGVITLMPGTTVDLDVDSSDGKANCFAVNTSHRRWLICADTREGKEAWVNALERRLGRGGRDKDTTQEQRGLTTALSAKDLLTNQRQALTPSSPRSADARASVGEEGTPAAAPGHRRLTSVEIHESQCFSSPSSSTTSLPSVASLGDSPVVSRTSSAASLGLSGAAVRPASLLAAGGAAETSSTRSRHSASLSTRAQADAEGGPSRQSSNVSNKDAGKRTSSRSRRPLSMRTVGKTSDAVDDFDEPDWVNQIRKSDADDGNGSQTMYAEGDLTSPPPQPIGDAGDGRARLSSADLPAPPPIVYDEEDEDEHDSGNGSDSDGDDDDDDAGAKGNRVGRRGRTKSMDSTLSDAY